jgi:hypothetical protein
MEDDDLDQGGLMTNERDPNQKLTN